MITVDWSINPREVLRYFVHTSYATYRYWIRWQLPFCDQEDSRLISYCQILAQNVKVRASVCVWCVCVCVWCVCVCVHRSP